MRIVHVSDCYPPRTGGIESHVSDLARRQAALGHDVHVLTGTIGPDGERDGAVHDDHGVLVHRLGTRMPYDAPVNPAARRLTREFLREVEVDVVHVHAGVLAPFAYDCATVARDEELPLAITWHSMLDKVSLPARWIASLSGWRRIPAALSAVSARAADEVARVMDADVDVLPNGIDLSAWVPADPGPLRAHPLHLVATQRLVPRKRAPMLADIVAGVVERVGRDAVRLTVLGDGATRRQLERRVARYGLEDVIDVRGAVVRSELHAIYRTAQVFVAPARREAFGIAPLEARTAGLAVVLHGGTGTAEFIEHGREGLVVDSDEGMVEAIVRLVEEDGLLERIRRGNITDPPAFGWSEVLASAEEQYERAMRLRFGLPARA